ncbi:hypothetical protein SNE40_007323 [Patella caerulea]
MSKILESRRPSSTISSIGGTSKGLDTVIQTKIEKPLTLTGIKLLGTLVNRRNKQRRKRLQSQEDSMELNM